MKTIVTLTIFTIVALLTAKSNFIIAKTSSIKSPYPLRIEQKIDAPKHKCSKPAKPPKQLKFNSIYTDRGDGLSIVDHAARTKYKSQIKPIENYEKQIANWVDELIQKKTSSNSYCSIDWLYNWAKDDALLTNDANFQGQAVRKWFLAAIASNYYLLDQRIKIHNNKKIIIEKWIDRLTLTVIKDYSKTSNRNSRNNNHIYWSAWAVMIASSILDNSEYYNWALAHAKNGIQEIQNNGILPRELARNRRAFTYHVFAAAPLIMIAETAKQNGIDLYNQNNGALHRLVNLIVTELNHKQSALTALTGRKQDTKNVITPYSLAWLEVYNSRFPSARTQKLIDKLEPMKARRLGGNMSVLFAKDVTAQGKAQ